MARWFAVYTLLVIGTFSLVGCGTSSEPVVLPTTAQTEDEKKAAQDYEKMLQDQHKEQYGSGN